MKQNDVLFPFLIVHSLSKDELRRLLETAKACRERDWLVILVAFHHGLRASEVVEMTPDNVADGYLTMPLVVDRSMRTDYIAALESADRGNLEHLAMIFAGLEKGAILQALSLDVEAEQRAERSLTSAVIESLEAKFNKRRQVRRQELLGMNAVAERLRSIASESVERNLQELARKVFLRDERPEVHVIEVPGRTRRLCLGPSSRELFGRSGREKLAEGPCVLLGSISAEQLRVIQCACVRRERTRWRPGKGPGCPPESCAHFRTNSYSGAGVRSA